VTPAQLEQFLDCVAHPALRRALEPLGEKIPQWFSEKKHGDFVRWRQALYDLATLLPAHPTGPADLNRPSIRVGAPITWEASRRQKVIEHLMKLHPWRKGPFDFFGIPIETEWRSDLKWARLAPVLENPSNRLVLDVGSGNGYFSWRMRGAGARAVLAIDPMLLYTMQFELMAAYIKDPAVIQLPITLEELPGMHGVFDTVLSLGVLYHRRSPFEHLARLRTLLRPGGQLLLETLVVEGDAQTVLLPEGRYAKMRNVWFIPSPQALKVWLTRAGFKHIQVASVHQTDSREQRTTEWMTFESLNDFLMPGNPNKTIEGYPAPRRALLTARAPF